MRLFRVARHLVWLLALLVAAPSVGARAATLRVPSEYTTIQGAIDAASFADTVLVAPGEYTEYTTRAVPGYGSITATSFLKDGVVLRGEGGASGTILRAGPSGSSFADALVAFGLASEATIVEGFSIVSDLPSRNGIAQLDGKKLTIRECVFRGLDLWAINANFSDLEVVDSRFEDCLGLGGISQEEGLSLLTRCTFLRCNTPVDLSGFAGNPVDRAEIRECVFQDCVRESGDGGGGGAIQVRNYFAGVLIDRCLFDGCRTDQYGGAIAIGGGSPVVSNCVFQDNQAVTLGGSLVINSFTAQVTGNTLWGSTLLNSVQGAGAAVRFFVSNSAQFSNNIIASTTGPPAIAVDGTLTSGCNVFWNNASGVGFNYTPGPTDRIADPLFCDPVAGDLELADQSPCLPVHSLGCGLIGALGEGCGTIAVEETSWGEIKAAYRKGE